MRSAAGTRNNDLQASVQGRCGVFEQEIRRAMGRHDPDFMIDPECVKCLA
jgi:hypothetical protein